jgi:hypothetical protein
MPISKHRQLVSRCKLFRARIEVAGVNWTRVRLGHESMVVVAIGLLKLSFALLAFDFLRVGINLNSDLVQDEHTVPKYQI